MQSPSSESVVNCNADVLAVVQNAWRCAAETGASAATYVSTWVCSRAREGARPHVGQL